MFSLDIQKFEYEPVQKQSQKQVLIEIKNSRLKLTLLKFSLIISIIVFIYLLLNLNWQTYQTQTQITTIPITSEDIIDEPLSKESPKLESSISSVAEFTQLIPSLPIEVHLISHSHDDLGWYKTAQEYYDGGGHDFFNYCVRDIITNVVEELIQDPSKTYVQAEMAYFAMWWLEQPEYKKHQARQLVFNRQLEFVNGGISAPDESTAYYTDLIDNYSWGHRFIADNFGTQFLPKVGWQLDTFGHTQGQVKMFGEMGYSAWFLARFDYQDREKRMNQKTMEFLTDAGAQDKIFTHYTYKHYNSPPGFHIDEFENQPEVQDHQVEEKGKALVDYFRQQAIIYDQNIIMHLYGDDFAFRRAKMKYSSMDKVLKYINENFNIYNMKILYSTPSRYIQTVKYNIKKNYTRKYDDFLPFGDKQYSYWTGFYSSRPGLKLYVRETGKFLQTIKTLISLLIKEKMIKESILGSLISNLNKLEYNQGLLQHHDAVSGTSTQRVTDNYIFVSYSSLSTVRQDLINIFQARNQQIGYENQNYQFCGWNQTYAKCEPMVDNFKDQGRDVMLNVYNPGIQGNFIMRVRGAKSGYQVYDTQGLKLTTDVICTFVDQCDIYFLVHLQSLSFSNYIIKKDNSSNIIQQEEIFDEIINLSKSTQLIYTKDKYLRGFQMIGDISEWFQLQYGYYKSCDDEYQSSGIYNFRCCKESQKEFLPYDDYDSNKVVKDNIFIGKIISIVVITTKKVQTKVKFFTSKNNIYSNNVEIETLLNSVRLQNEEKGKEIVIAINTNIKNNKTFWTDSNGLQMQKRVLNQRDTWDLKDVEYVPHNYYPVTSSIGIEDGDKSVYILNDRSQGGSSLKEGQLELMIHRRLDTIDGKGLNEGLDEYEDGVGLKVRVRHFLVFANREKLRKLQYREDHQPLILYSNINSIDNKLKKQVQKNQFEFDYTQEGLKVNLQFINDKFYLLRFHNMLETKQISLNLTNLNITEMGLTGVEVKKIMEIKKIRWENILYDNSESSILKPQEIKTYLFI